VPRIPGIPDKVLVAPESFKGTFGVVEVAAAIARGFHDQGFVVDLCPVADGGEGTLQVLAEALGAELRNARVCDPLLRDIEAPFALGGGDSRRRTAIVEAAAASGLELVAPNERDPVAATTFGTGQLIAAAIAAGAGVIYVGVGGTATTDGGAGAIRALRQAGGVGEARIVVLCDVRTQFQDAARMFAPQKGAGAQDVRRLSQRLHALARRLERDPRGLPMTGAAGGLAGGLWAAFGAELVPGSAFVLDALDFESRMRSARAVVTGEGKLDRQSLAGKAVSEVATRARQGGVPCHAIVGQRDLDRFGARILDLQAVLEASTLRAVTAAARKLGEMI
jgi:glycerate kinase